METHWQSSSLIQHPIAAPWLGDSLIWRRYGGGVGNRCRWADRFAMSEQRQSMERHFQRSRELFRTDRGRPCPREWEDPQAKRCGRDGAKRKSVRKSCRSTGDPAWKRMRQHREAVTGWGHRCGLAKGAVEDRGKRESQQAPAREATCRQGAPSGSSCRQG